MPRPTRRPLCERIHGRRSIVWLLNSPQRSGILLATETSSRFAPDDTFQNDIPSHTVWLFSFPRRFLSREHARLVLRPATETNLFAGPALSPTLPADSIFLSAEQFVLPVGGGKSF